MFFRREAATAPQWFLCKVLLRRFQVVPVQDTSQGRPLVWQVQVKGRRWSWRELEDRASRMEKEEEEEGERDGTSDADWNCIQDSVCWATVVHCKTQEREAE